MRIWANNAEEGESFWYERISGLPGSGFRYSKVVMKDTKSFRMPCLVMENGDRVFVNTWVYESLEDIPDQKIGEAVIYIESFILEHENKIKTSQQIIEGLKNDIERIKLLKTRKSNEKEEQKV